MTSTTFPTHPRELTAGWLTEVLRGAGVLGAGAEVVGYDTEPVGEGVGMLGILLRLRPRYTGDAAGAPRSLIAKFATDNEANRAVGNAFRVYEREARFFRTVAPVVPSAGPACWAAEIDPDSGDSVVLMEDLSDYRIGDQVVGCGVEEAAQILDTVAAVHAAYWGRVDDEALSWVPHIDGETQIAGISGGCVAGWDPTMATFGDVVPDEVKAERDRFLAAMPEIHRMMGRRTQTLIHGDVRLDNIFFGQADGQHPVVLLDWQGIIISNPGQDVAYLLTQNLTIPERREHERALVERYHRGLVERGVTGYPLEQCWEDYRLGALYVFGYGIVIAGTLDPSNERGKAFMGALVERAAAAFVDLRLAELIPG